MAHRTPESRTRTTRRRPTSPKRVRQVARAAGLSLRGLAEAIIDGQPAPERPRDQRALLHWLSQSVRNGHPGAPLDQLAETMAGRLQGMVDGEDATAKALLDAAADEEILKLAQIEIALAGAWWAPAATEVPRQERMDMIASTVLKLTGWESVDDEAVQAIYRWLYGDEAAFVAATEMRVEAGLRMLDSGDPRPVRVLHPDTGELVLVTPEEIIEHAEADGRVLEAARRYEEQQAQRHERLIRALRPYGDSSTSVGDAVRRAAADLGIEVDGRSFHQLASLVVAAAEARAGSPEAEPFSLGGTLRVPE